MSGARFVGQPSQFEADAAAVHETVVVVALTARYIPPNDDATAVARNLAAPGAALRTYPVFSIVYACSSSKWLRSERCR